MIYKASRGLRAPNTFNTVKKVYAPFYKRRDTAYNVPDRKRSSSREELSLSYYRRIQAAPLSVTARRSHIIKAGAGDPAHRGEGVRLREPGGRFMNGTPAGNQAYT